MDKKIYDSLMGFAKKLADEDKRLTRAGSYTLISTAQMPVGESYQDRIARAMESSRELQKREGQ